MLSRRKFLTIGAVGAIAGGALATTRLENTTALIELEEREIVLEDLPKNFDGYRIGVLSDLHLGQWVPKDLIAQAVALIRRQQPDLLLLAGDYIWIPESRSTTIFPRIHEYNLTGNELIDAIYSTVADLVSAAATADGICAVYGNHDRWVSPRSCRKHMRERGINFLENEVFEVVRGNEKLQIAGVDDYWTGFPKLPFDRPVAGKNAELRVLLCHNPDYFSEVLRRGPKYFHLGVAGHTHGGQVILPGLGAVTYNIRDLRFKSGYYRDDRTAVYTTRGVGVVEIPWRINCPPEATVLTLLRA